MKIKDKLTKVDDTFTVTRYDNGFMVEVRGEDANEDWATVQIITELQSDVVFMFGEYCDMEKRG